MTADCSCPCCTKERQRIETTLESWMDNRVKTKGKEEAMRFLKHMQDWMREQKDGDNA